MCVYIFNFSTNRRNAHFLRAMQKFCLIKQPSETRKKNLKLSQNSKVEEHIIN